MLVLSRKVGQRIMIGNDITILVSRVSGKRVTLGLEAPKDVIIRRAELSPEVTANGGERNDEEESDEEPDEDDVFPLDRVVVGLAPHPFASL